MKMQFRLPGCGPVLSADDREELARTQLYLDDILRADMARSQSADLVSRLQQTLRLPIIKPVRHCLGHLYPFAGNDLWKWHIQQLVERLPLFNGRVLLSVALDHTTVSWEAVVAALPPDSQIELQFIANDRKSGERESFRWGLSQLASEIANPDAFLFYWHSKAVSIAPNDPVHDWHAVRRWAESLWLTCGDGWPLVQKQLSAVHVTGSHRQPWKTTGTVYYGGNFFWCRLAALAGRPWWKLDADRWCVEKWPGQMFPRAETACLFDDRLPEGSDRRTLYQAATWPAKWPALGEFLRAQGSPKSLPPLSPSVRVESPPAAPPPAPKVAVTAGPVSATIIITCGPRYDRWVRDALASALEQQGSPEIVCVFDRCEPVPDINPRVKVLRVDHGSPQLARRAGLAAATGDIICCLDADNRYAGSRFVTTAVQQLRAATAADSRVAGLIPSISYYQQDWSPATQAKLIPPERWDLERFERSNFLDTSAPVWKHALEASWPVTAANSYHEDHHMWRQLTAAGWVFSPAPELELQYRLMPDSRTNYALPGGYSETYGYHTAPVTLFIPLAGRAWAWPALRDWLREFAASERGSSVRLVLCDTSQDETFHETVRREGLALPFGDVRYYRQPSSIAGLADLDRATHERLVQITCAQIYNRMAQDATTHLVWVLEDDTLPHLPGAQALRVLVEGLHLNVAAVSGAYPDRRSDHLIAWTSGTGDKLQNVRPEQLAASSGDYLPILGAGFGCLLIRREVLRLIPHAIPAGERWYDPRFFQEVAKRGLKVQLAKGVLCDHREKLPTSLPPRPVPVAPLARVTRPKVVALYLPGFHRDPINDRAWGDGWTEWDGLRRWQPNKPGHTIQRPHADLGEYDLMDVAARRKQGQLAREYGVHGFAVYHYWFSGIKALHRPWEQRLLDGEPDLPFHLVWANEPWTRRWDGSDHELIQAQTYGDRTEWRAHAEYLRPFLEHPQYIQHAGRRVLGIYRPGTIPQLTERLAYYREVLGSDLHFAALYGPHAADQVPTLSPQLDSAILFEPFARVYAKGEPALLPHQRLFRGAGPGTWDNSPRRGLRALVIPQPAFRHQLHALRGEDTIYINAWNEWGEGVVLEPSDRDGYARLKEIAAFVGAPPCEN